MLTYYGHKDESARLVTIQIVRIHAFSRWHFGKVLVASTVDQP